MLFEHPSFEDHEKVIYAHDTVTDLRAIIAIHSTKAGPAAGGTRFYNYANSQYALTDVLRLSYGMTLKNIMAGLKIGGGKSVIIGDPKKINTPNLMASFGKAINDLAGQYYCAEDVGTSVADMEIVKQHTRFVAGLKSGAHASGDPSPFTALGVFSGIKASAKYKFGDDDLTGLKIGILGLGHVGYDLVDQLHRAGAKLYVADINSDILQKAKQMLGARIVDVNEIALMDLDIFAPCALGGIITQDVAKNTKAKIIAGAANNQLIGPKTAEILSQNNILYAPDFVINAGGIMNVEDEILGNYDRDKNLIKTKNIGNTLNQIYQQAEQEGLPTAVIAEKIALKRLAEL